MLDRDDSAVRVTVNDGVAEVVLASAATRNALSLGLATEMRDGMESVCNAPGVRVIVLRSEGSIFSVGGDLKAFRSAPMGANLNDVVARPIHETIELMNNARQPVVCAVQGSVGGGAVGLVLAADISVMAETAVFRMGYTGSGLSPDCAVSWYLPRLAGLPIALDLLLTNRRVSAEEALRLGMISRVTAEESLESTIADIVAGMARIPFETLSETKRLTRRSMITDLHSQLDDEARTIGRLGDTSDTREAIAAFLDKRPPVLSS
ncbi:enoyl-CoA hydratase/isomerase family protein [Jatrophihabitans lederbergiae]|uniref:Enoyl-CoA hydratase-related protein n=1 Tax=Jatrophihabitans lederbergiae TaxID=3075547 RepID=A0ABU2JE61_9ACTN|nr:enoyl-CoA hydratase-related protein [Jatrophihabitans sp. DSM 44399]MDT0262759.1 enoyl-CoA hydratase-related protein [Jatrophihabitans sp. DSM 44399]